MKHIKDELNFLNQFLFSETSKEKKLILIATKLIKIYLVLLMLKVLSILFKEKKTQNWQNDQK